MKTLTAILILTLSGCASIGAYITTHQVTIAAIGVTAGATAAMTSTAVNVVTLEKDAKGK